MGQSKSINKLKNNIYQNICLDTTTIIVDILKKMQRLSWKSCFESCVLYSHSEVVQIFSTLTRKEKLTIFQNVIFLSIIYLLSANLSFNCGTLGPDEFPRAHLENQNTNCEKSPSENRGRAKRLKK